MLLKVVVVFRCLRLFVVLCVVMIGLCCYVAVFADLCFCFFCFFPLWCCVCVCCV